MKRKLLLAAATLCLFFFGGGGNSVWATDWVGNEPANGEFYLYNVAADRYLSFGENWSSIATADHAGIPVTLTLSNGNYTITTNVAENGKGLFMANDMAYTDGTPGEWTFTDANVAGKHVYTLQSGGAYLYWSGTEVSQVLSKTTDISGIDSEKLQWQLVTKAERDAAFTNKEATEASPLDITYKYIENPNTTWFTNLYSTNNPWTKGGAKGWDVKDGNSGWWDGKDKTYEVYNGNFDNYIEITGIPNGKYEFGVQGFYRDGSAENAIAHYHDGTFVEHAKIYANANTTSLQSIGVSEQTSQIYAGNDKSAEVSGTTYYVPNSPLGGSLYFLRGKYPWQSVSTVVTDGTLRFGVKKEATISSDWTLIDKFYLSYLGPTIDAMAEALPEGNMVVDKWYYFDIPATGDYVLEATETLNDIVYTIDNTILYENESSVTAHFAATTPIALSQGRYYVKSASAQTLSVTSSSDVYEVGAPTLSVADGKYTQSSTFTVTFPNAATNTEASPSLVANSTATVNGSEVALTAADGGFSLELGTLTPATSYAISIPADVYGYVEGDGDNHMNSAISLTVNTPAVFDGKYFLKSDYLYLSRGGSYNTQAIADEYGLPVDVSTNANNITEFIFIDNWFHLFDADNGNLYTDNNTANDFAIEATNGGYYVINKNQTEHSTKDGKLYIDESDENRVKVSTTTGTVWTFDPCNSGDHKTRMQTLKDAQAASVATTAGVSATTQAAFASALEDGYSDVGITITGTTGIAESYQQGAGNTTGSPLKIFEETVTGLQPGLYKLSVKAFERITWHGDVYNAGGSPGLTYLYANDEKVQLWSLFDYPSDAALDNQNVNYDGKYYADTTTGAQKAFDAGDYVNDVYVWVTDEGEGTGSITFGINKPHRYGNDGSRGAWVCYNDFTLTYYMPIITKTSSANLEGYKTFYNADYNYEVDANTTIYKATSKNDESVTITEVDGKVIPAGTPVIVKTSNTEDYIITFTPTTEDAEGDFTGNILAAANGGETNRYILGYLSGEGNGLGFYKYEPSLDAGDVYLNVSNTANVRLGIIVDGEATAINGVNAEAGKANEATYNMAGQRVNGSYKGIVIKNGKKYMIK